jgi:hypothetical protein
VLTVEVFPEVAAAVQRLGAEFAALSPSFPSRMCTVLVGIQRGIGLASFTISAPLRVLSSRRQLLPGTLTNLDIRPAPSVQPVGCIRDCGTNLSRLANLNFCLMLLIRTAIALQSDSTITVCLHETMQALRCVF